MFYTKIIQFPRESEILLLVKKRRLPYILAYKPTTKLLEVIKIMTTLTAGLIVKKLTGMASPHSDQFAVLQKEAENSYPILSF